MVATTLAAIARHKTIENSVVAGNLMASVLLSGADTNGTFSLLQMVQRPGTEPPYHVHEREDEAFYLLEGHVTFMVDGKIIEAYAGDCVFLPRQVPHTFKVRSEIARGLLILTPAGFENFFRSIGEPAQSLADPQKREPRHGHFDVVGRASAKQGVRIMLEQPEF
jgi:mannose-6-phosphate isomerase-like protein (cupin superfamily)